MPLSVRSTRASRPRRTARPALSDRHRLALAEALLAAPTQQACFAEVARWIRKLRPASRGVLFLHNTTIDRYEALAAWGISPSSWQRLRFFSDEVTASSRSSVGALRRSSRVRGAVLAPLGEATAHPVRSASVQRGLLLDFGGTGDDLCAQAAVALGRRLEAVAFAAPRFEADSARSEELQALLEASTAKSQFLANMSHEIRTPLNAILGYTSMLLEGVAGELSERQRKSISRVDSNAQSLLRLINDILDIAKIDSGKVEVGLEPTDAARLAIEVVEDLGSVIQASGLEVKVDAPSSVGIVSDVQKVKQILRNLIGNALKFTPKGSVTITVRDEGAMARISIRDTGIGIAPEHHRRVFEEFRQVDESTTRKYGGSGLGLSISARLTKMLGGRLTLESALGQGSTFTLSLPRTESAP